MLVVPFGIAAFAIHTLEFFIQRRLSRRFGWNSVLVTGWLGTPIHELSHALMCYTFRHKIDEMALFKPDEQSGRLGYVRHSYQKGNRVQELGNLFIGIAPLMGGTLVLTVLLFLFYPDFAGKMFRGEMIAEETSWVGQFVEIGKATLWQFSSFENLGTVRFWVFLYLVLCVASHMAPSRSDYEGAGKPALWVALGFGLLCALIAMTGVAGEVTEICHQLMRPVVGLFALSIGLCVFASIVVWLVTMIWDIFF